MGIVDIFELESVQGHESNFTTQTHLVNVWKDGGTNFVAVNNNVEQSVTQEEIYNLRICKNFSKIPLLIM